MMHSSGTPVEDSHAQYHAKLRALHDRHNLPYRYLEWRTALRELL